MTFYLVGPSGAGKTTLASALETQGLVRFVDSDVELKGVEGSWESVLELLNSYESMNDTIPLLLAIGAGTQDIDRNDPQRPLRNWLRTRSEHVLAIMCSPNETFRRRAEFHDTLESVLRTEFAPARLDLYKIAGQSVSTSGHTESDSIGELARALNIEAESRPGGSSDGHEPLRV